MALLWEHDSNGCHYEVRSAGKSVRLYSNGVFHSQWNPERLLGNAIWDLLVMAAFPLARARNAEKGAECVEKPLRVLVLGVGGGAAIRQLLGLFKIELIQGIDLDATHLAVAKRWFGLVEYPQVKLVQQDAVEWVTNYRGPGFDIVIDDLFGHQDTDLSRSVVFSEDWAANLLHLLQGPGAVVVNSAANKEFKLICQKLRTGVSNQGKHALGVGFMHPRYDNRVLVNLLLEAQPHERKENNESNLNSQSNGNSKLLNLPPATSFNSRHWRRQWSDCVKRQMSQSDLSKQQQGLICSLSAGYLDSARKAYIV